ncbi:MAG: cytochrome P460 family protein [Alphaproteobacteria bacterium]|nr:cytochrome P460 family protein [Alphaproteobacteria bacterium]MCB9927879.1 cytochrome P460 family protein [Alphaproteobacteria bacterium]
MLAKTLGLGLALLLTAGTALAAGALAADCPDLQPAKLVPSDPARCAALRPIVGHPGALPLNEYEANLQEFFGNFCHRDTAAGWVRDKRVRDTGPYTNRFVDGEWVGQYYGTHQPVVIWYSPDFHAWLKANRPLEGSGRAPANTPIPEGAMIVKEMMTAPAARCAAEDPLQLLPSSGAAFMVRDSQASQDGWYWGWFGWTTDNIDWPPRPSNGLPYQGFGQYCMNCHASAADNLTFAALNNIQGEPGEPLAFLSQDYALDPTPPITHHREITLPKGPAPRLGDPLLAYNGAFADTFGRTVPNPPSWESVSKFPSASYDVVWVKKGQSDVAGLESQYVTSDQCVGCHDAGGTGLQFDMTKPLPVSQAHGYMLENLSPYGTWRSSPMGLAGRDPIFFAQLASEVQTFHPATKANPETPALVENTCLGCHGILGQRQFELDTVLARGDPTDQSACGDFTRAMVAAVPYPPGNPGAKHADYGALARDGISCAACHHAVLDPKVVAKVQDQPQNTCVKARQDFLNKDLSGFARTFTGSFFVGPPDELYGPFPKPKPKPMQHALGITPHHDSGFASSELCGTCHTVHLPVFYRGRTLRQVYEQTTYPEWLFSAFRTDAQPTTGLSYKAGASPQSCGGCHMKTQGADGKPFVSKIAGIQEHSNFPAAENALGAEDIDLEPRSGFARHTLVGLNVFLVNMAQQFPDVFGIATADPMLTSKGLPSLLRTEQAMLDQATHAVAGIAVVASAVRDGTLTATVAVNNKVGHKFPSGVGFRRAFIEFRVLDRLGRTLWASGRTNGAGVIVDDQGRPIAGELWWADDCSARLSPGQPQFQPHYQRVTRQDQAQIYQELVTSPAPVENPQCGKDPTPGGDLTTSFLSICANVKDNRLLPDGFLPLAERIDLAKSIGAGADLAEEAGPHHVGDDPHYRPGKASGGDALDYVIPLADLPGEPVAVQAILHYQATPPFYLQDRFCTAKGPDRDRLYFLAGHLNLDGSAMQDWRFEIVSSGVRPIGQ